MHVRLSSIILLLILRTPVTAELDLVLLYNVVDLSQRMLSPFHNIHWRRHAIPFLSLRPGPLHLDVLECPLGYCSHEFWRRARRTPIIRASKRQPYRLTRGSTVQLGSNTRSLQLCLPQPSANSPQPWLIYNNPG